MNKKTDAKIVQSEKADERRGRALEKKTDADIEAKRKKTEADVAAKQNATALGRSKTKLAGSSPDELSSNLSSLIGNTPSTVDFEG